MQKNFQSKFNLLNVTDKYWMGTKICQKKYLKSPQWLRDIKTKKRPLWKFYKPKERFYELRKEAFEFVDKYNRKAKFRRGITSLRHRGIKATWKRVYSHYYSKFISFTNVKL